LHVPFSKALFKAPRLWLNTKVFFLSVFEELNTKVAILFFKELNTKVAILQSAYAAIPESGEGKNENENENGNRNL
jgi:hypothetical protein